MWNMQTKLYHIIILDVNIITVSALSVDAMVVKLAHLAEDPLGEFTKILD